MQHALIQSSGINQVVYTSGIDILIKVFAMSEAKSTSFCYSSYIGDYYEMIHEKTKPSMVQQKPCLQLCTK